LADAATLAVAAEISSSDGIAPTFAAWKGGQDDRWQFYLSVVRRQIAALERQAKVPLAGLPLVISGMASSSIGMRELPYRDLPFAIDGSDLSAQPVAASGDFPHELMLVSGARTATDVMRGEETQLIGALAGDSPTASERIFLFPGTHSKHVTVAGDRAIGFQTYMTGEFFQLLARQSVLADSVAPEGAWDEGENRTGFEAGVREGARVNLLHACFGVRVNGLFGRSSKPRSYHYLSGLLIGCELRELGEGGSVPLTVVADPVPAARYRHALRLLGPDRKIAVKGVEESLVKGQARIAAHLGWWR